MIRSPSIQNCHVDQPKINLFHSHPYVKPLVYIITGVAVASLGILAASIQQYPLGLALGVIGLGLIAKGINEYGKVKPKQIKLIDKTDENKNSLKAKAAETEKKVEKVVGKATVFGKLDQAPHDITITETYLDYDDQALFTAYIEKNGKKTKVGDISVVWLRLKEDGKYGSKNFIDCTDGFGLNQYYWKHGEEKNKSKILIPLMKSNAKENYRGIGTALFQVAIEHGYRLGCEGRTVLDAAWNSHGFHYKQGMRSWPEMNQKIVEELEKAKAENREPDTRKLTSVPMHMPQEGMQMWKKKIAEHPILFKDLSSNVA